MTTRRASPTSARRPARSHVSAPSILFALAIFMATGAAVIVVSLVRADLARDHPRRSARPAAVGPGRRDPRPAARHVRDRVARVAAGRRRHVLRAGRRQPTQQPPAAGHAGRHRRRDRRDHRGQLTFDPVPALWAAGVAAVVGLGAAAAANRFGRQRHPRDARARSRPTRGRDGVLIDVVQRAGDRREHPDPAHLRHRGRAARTPSRPVATPQHASIAVTRGLLERMDREQLQGVIGHELGHVRNLDTRYALYVAVLVGLVALVTDGFLRLVIEGWKQGVFIWKGDDEERVRRPRDGPPRRSLPADRRRPAAPLRAAVLGTRPGVHQPRARVPRRRHVGRVHAQPARPRAGADRRWRTTTTRSTPRTAARSTCGSATRSRRAAIVAPACSRPTRRSAPGSIDCASSRASTRSTRMPLQRRLRRPDEAARAGPRRRRHPSPRTCP